MNNEEKSLNIIDRFLYKLVIGLFILLSLVVLDRLKIIDIDVVRAKMNQHYNPLKTIQTINGNLEIINIGTGKEITVSTELKTTEYINENTVKIKSDVVLNHIAGVVVKIIKDDTYTITLLGIDDETYTYENLDSFDYHIYSYLKTDDIIGLANGYYILITGK